MGNQMVDTQRRPGRPRREIEPVTPQKLGEATIALLIEEGAPSLTMSKLAQRLDVRSQSLYHHVSGTDEAVSAARLILFGRIDREVLRGADFGDAVEQFAVEYLRVFLPIAEANSVFFSHRIADGVTLGLYQDFVKRAVAEGWEDQAALALLFEI